MDFYHSQQLEQQQQKCMSPGVLSTTTKTRNIMWLIVAPGLPGRVRLSESDVARPGVSSATPPASATSTSPGSSSPTGTQAGTGRPSATCSLSAGLRVRSQLEDPPPGGDFNLKFKLLLLATTVVDVPHTHRYYKSEAPTRSHGTSVLLVVLQYPHRGGRLRLCSTMYSLLELKVQRDTHNSTLPVRSAQQKEA